MLKIKKFTEDRSSKLAYLEVKGLDSWAYRASVSLTTNFECQVCKTRCQNQPRG